MMYIIYLLSIMYGNFMKVIENEFIKIEFLN